MKKQTMRKQLASGSGKPKATVDKRQTSRIIPTKTAKQTSRSRMDIFYKHFSFIMSISFRYQPFVVVSVNLRGKVSIVDHVSSFLEQEKYPTTSLDENCVGFELRMDRNYNVDLRRTYLALKLKLVKGLGYET